MTPTSATSNLLKIITKPSKVALNLDWKKLNGSKILSMDIHKDHIGLCVAEHPSVAAVTTQLAPSSSSDNSNNQSLCQTLEPIRFPEGHISITPDCIQRLDDVVEDHSVCGIVVAWPLQHDTARMGAACGRVLYTLENMIEHDSQKVLTPSRPVCLWDSEHRTQQLENPQQAIDSWGRCPAYAHTPDADKEEHIASKEQYFEDEGIVAAKVWEDFCKVHWPELFYHEAKDQEQQHALDPDQVISLAPTSIWERTAPVINGKKQPMVRASSAAPLSASKKKSVFSVPPPSPPPSSPSKSETLSLIKTLAADKRKSLVHMRS